VCAGTRAVHQSQNHNPSIFLILNDKGDIYTYHTRELDPK